MDAPEQPIMIGIRWKVALLKTASNASVNGSAAPSPRT